MGNEFLRLRRKLIETGRQAGLGNQQPAGKLVGLLLRTVFFTAVIGGPPRKVRQGGKVRHLRQITMDDLTTAETTNLKFLEEMEAGSEMDHMAGLQNLMATYNQVPLLSAVIEALMADSEEEPELASENIGLALLHLKSVLDCLDQ